MVFRRKLGILKEGVEDGGGQLETMGEDDSRLSVVIVRVSVDLQAIARFYMLHVLFAIRRRAASSKLGRWGVMGLRMSEQRSRRRDETSEEKSVDGAEEHCGGRR